MKNKINNTVAIATALVSAGIFSSETKAQTIKEGCFWAQPIVKSSPGNPLTGSGFGTMSGVFENVEWYSGNIQPSGTVTPLDGTFSFDLAWNDADGDGINWTSDFSVPGILFDTTPGDSLLFGNFDIDAALDEDCTITEKKFLVCIAPDDQLVQEIKEVTEKGYGVYVTNGETYSQVTSKDYVFNLGDDRIGLDERGDYSTEKLSFAYSNDEGRSFIGGTHTEDFDTIVKIGACIECVPEPSSISLLGLGGLAMVLRRRRK